MSEGLLLAAFVVGVLAVARVVRLIVDDDYPPMVWARRKFVEHVPDDWSELVECPFCVAPYVTAVAAGLTWWSFNGDGKLDWWWWVPTLWLAVSYLAAMVNTRDVPPESR